MNTWILVADGAHARIFSADTATSPLTELESLIHPEAQQHKQKLTSDRPGSQAGGATGSYHGVSDRTDPKKYEAGVFAKELSRHLEDALNAQKFRQLIVVAAPAFLGHLRKELGSNTSKVVTLEVDKDIVEQDAASIREHLPEHLPHL